jgi:Uma2 family endonuclease
MPRQASPLKLTYDDYVALPDDGLRHEIIDGEHFVSAAPRLSHQRVASRLHLSLASYVATAELGEVLCTPVDVVLSRHDVVQPDILFLASATLAAAVSANHRFLGLPPNLVVEVLSPSTRRKDQVFKLLLYERAGVPEYWLVDPDLTTVTVYRRTDSPSAI